MFIDILFSIYFVFCSLALSWWQFPFQTSPIHFNGGFLVVTFLGPMHFVESQLVNLLNPLFRKRVRMVKLRNYCVNCYALKRRTAKGITGLYWSWFATGLVDLAATAAAVYFAMREQHYYYKSPTGALVGWTGIGSGLVAHALITLGYLLQALRGYFTRFGCLPQVFQEGESLHTIPGTGLGQLQDSRPLRALPTVLRIFVERQYPRPFEQDGGFKINPLVQPPEVGAPVVEDAVSLELSRRPSSSSSSSSSSSPMPSDSDGDALEAQIAASLCAFNGSSESE